MKTITFSEEDFAPPNFSAAAFITRLSRSVAHADDDSENPFSPALPQLHSLRRRLLHRRRQLCQDLGRSLPSASRTLTLSSASLSESAVRRAAAVESVVADAAAASAAWGARGEAAAGRARSAVRVLRHWGGFAGEVVGSTGGTEKGQNGDNDREQQIDALFGDEERLPEAAEALRSLRGFVKGEAGGRPGQEGVVGGPMHRGSDSEEDGFVVTSRPPTASLARERDIAERIEGYSAIVKGRILAKFRSCADRNDVKGMARFARAMATFPGGTAECAGVFIDGRSEVSDRGYVRYDGPSEAPLPDPRPEVSRLDVKRFTVDRARPDVDGAAAQAGSDEAPLTPAALRLQRSRRQLRGFADLCDEMALATSRLLPLLTRVFGDGERWASLFAERFVERRLVCYVRGLLGGLHPERAAECCVAIKAICDDVGLRMGLPDAHEAIDERVVGSFADVSAEHGGTSPFVAYEIALIEETHSVEIARLHAETVSSIASASSAASNSHAGGGAASGGAAGMPSAASVEMTLNLIHANAGALERCRFIHPRDPIPPTILFDILLGQVVGHVGGAIESGLKGLKNGGGVPSKITDQASVRNADLRIEGFLNLVRSACQIVQLVEHHHATSFSGASSMTVTSGNGSGKGDDDANHNHNHNKGGAIDHTNVINDGGGGGGGDGHRHRNHVEAACARRKDAALSALEESVRSGLIVCLGAVVARVGKILGTLQSKSDFRSPPESDTTHACASLLSFVRSHLATVQACLDGRNLHSYLHALGSHMFVVLFTHFRRFVYSFEGSFALQKDLNAYHNFAASMGAPGVEALFGGLRLVTSVMGIEGRNVVHVLSSADLLPALKTLLSMVQAREIAELVACREDAKGKLGKSIKEGVEKLCDGIVQRKY